MVYISRIKLTNETVSYGSVPKQQTTYKEVYPNKHYQNSLLIIGRQDFCFENLQNAWDLTRIIHDEVEA